MNCYFVSCEIAENPRLSGKILAVAPHTTDRRGIILSASYEARDYGIHSAMRVSDALRLCPELILLEPNMERYGEYSRRFFEYFLQISPLVEPASIDEGYLDVTDVCVPTEMVALAERIQREVWEIFHLPCSIGIASNKFLAKMASDMKKPQGITILRKRDIAELLWPLPVRRMIGVGKKTVEQLYAMGIKTIGDIATFQDQALFCKMLGEANARAIYLHAHGEGDNEVDVNRFTDITSISHSQTFDTDEYKIDNILMTVKLLCNIIANRLDKSELKASTFTLQIKYSNFKVVSRSQTIDKPLRDGKAMQQIVVDLFEDLYDYDYPVRLVGVAASKLVEGKEETKQLSMFDSLDKEEKDQVIDHLISNINQTIGIDLLKKGTLFEKSKSTITDKYDRRWSAELQKQKQKI